MNEYLQWYNVIYEIPLFMTLLFGASMFLGDFGHGDGDGGGDHDIGAHDAHHGLHSGNGHSEGHDLVTVHDANPLQNAIAYLGFGRIPITLLGADVCLCWGGSGLILNLLIAPSMGVSPGLVVAPVLAVTAFSTLVGTTVLVKVSSLIWPKTENFGLNQSELIGHLGTTDSTVSQRYGSASVVDRYHTTHTVECRVASEAPSILRGTRVLLTEYNHTLEVFTVEPAANHDL